MRFFCTYCDRNYLVRALALIDSLSRTQRGGWRLLFVCLDEITRTLLDALNLPNVVTIPLHDLERGDERLLATRADRTLVEYYWTMTPTVILRLLERHPEIDVLTYLDSDLFFYSSAEPVYDELGAGSVLIHEHRYSPEQAHLERESGRFNVGLLSFRRDAVGLGVLNWWRDRCIEWCYCRTEPGRFGDQMYLNDWPQRFEKVVVLGHVGAGLAPWNHNQYRVGTDAQGAPTVDGRTVVFYHFHSLVVIQPGVVVPTKQPDYALPEPILRQCFAPYAEALWRAANQVHAVLPTFNFGVAPDQAVSPRHTLLARAEPGQIDLGPRRVARWGDWTCFFAAVASPHDRPLAQAG